MALPASHLNMRARLRRYHILSRRRGFAQSHSNPGMARPASYSNPGARLRQHHIQIRGTAMPASYSNPGARLRQGLSYSEILVRHAILFVSEPGLNRDSWSLKWEFEIANDSPGPGTESSLSCYLKYELWS
ncbi:hypothetical protein L1987_34884 [Smallanthus sonchifolius]|uniref:Uncharacterized protein n=1 Tax=Smallanthus sonchifolius TaxID=185202 RepID=A0ACB9HWH7_9ASTR|nr:hypothetical protein L1987_34884 [Smallanthus sonchifolius]